MGHQRHESVEILVRIQAEVWPNHFHNHRVRQVQALHPSLSEETDVWTGIELKCGERNPSLLTPRWFL